MSRADILRAQAQHHLDERRKHLAEADDALEALDLARLMHNPLSIETQSGRVECAHRLARESLAEARRLVAEARAWERRATCCARGPQRAVCSLRVGHGGAEHHDEVDQVRWAVEGRKAS